MAPKLTFSRKFYNLGNALSQGGSLAAVGARGGSLAVTFDALSRIGSGLIEQDFKQRSAEVLKQAKMNGASEAEQAALEKHMVQLRQDQTLAADQFNQGAKAAYVARLKTSAENMGREIAARHPTDPAAFASDFANAKQTLSDQLPPEWRDGMTAMLDQYGSKLHSTISVAAAKQQNDSHNADLLTGQNSASETAMQAFRDGNVDGIMNSLGEFNYYLDHRTDLSPQQKERAKQDFHDQGQRNQALGGLDRVLNGTDGLNQASTYIQAFQKDQTLVKDPTRRDKIAAEMTGLVKDKKAAAKTRQSEIESKAKADRASQIAALDLGVSRGKIGHKDLEQARQQGVFNGNQEKFTALSKAVDARNKKRHADADNISLVAGAVGGSVILDPGNPDHRKAVDAYFTSVVAPGLAGQSPETVASRAVDYVRQTGIIPKTVVGFTRAALRSGQPDQVAAAADLILRLQELPGRVMNDFNSRDIALGLKISELTRAGVAVDQAVADAKRQMDISNKAVIETRQGEIKAEKLPGKYLGWVKSYFDPTGLSDFLPFGPSNDAALPGGVREQAVADFSLLFEDAYSRTGDKDIAKKLAFREMSRVWATTSVDGGLRAMKYAPEAFYSIGGDQSWMSRQLIADIGQTGKIGVDLADVTLVSDSTTARQASGGRPTYIVMVKNSDGVLEPVSDKGGLMRWRPDPAAAKSGRDRKALDKAKTLRKAAIAEDLLVRQGFGPGGGIP